MPGRIRRGDWSSSRSARGGVPDLVAAENLGAAATIEAPGVATDVMSVDRGQGVGTDSQGAVNRRRGESHNAEPNAKHPGC